MPAEVISRKPKNCASDILPLLEVTSVPEHKDIY